MEDENAPVTQRDLPAEPHAESRAETITKAVDANETALAEAGGSVDPSTSRGINTQLRRALLRWSSVGLVAGVVLGVILSLSPGPFETHTVGGAIGYAALLGLAGALIFALIGGLTSLEREDGRVERDVEQETGRGPEGPASPS